MNKKLTAFLVAAVICFQCVGISAADISSASDKKSDIESENSQLQQDIQQNQSAIDKHEDEQQTISELIDSINTAIDDARGKILELDEQMRKSEQAMQDTQKQIDNEADALRKRLRAVYMAGDTSNLEIILGASDFSDFIDKIELVKNISEYDNKLINNLKNSVALLQKQKEELSSSKSAQQTEQEKLSSDQKKFADMLEENKDALGDLYSKYNEASDSLDANNDELALVEQQIADYYANQKEEETQAPTEKSTEQTTQPATKEIENNSKTEDNSTNIYNNATNSGSNGTGSTSADSDTDISASGYVWPTPGFYNLTSLWNEDRGSYNHGALDIAEGGIAGTKVVAAANGTVVIASDTCTHNYGKSSSCGCGGGYGNWVMIDHGNGKATVYAHMESITVSNGDSVKAGQTIGYVGSTGDSSGAHLHFETRLNGTKYNPLNEYPSINITY